MPSVRGVIHCVTDYRCFEGRFLYYDPAVRGPHPAFQEYLARHRVKEWNVIVQKAAFQKKSIDTCTYNALTFLDKVDKADFCD